MTTDNPEVSADAINTEGTGSEEPVSVLPQDTTEIPTDNVEESGKTEDVQPNYREQLDQEKKNYKELQRKFTEVTQDRSSMRKDFDGLKDAMSSLQGSVSQMTKKPPPSPEQFIIDLQKNGIGAIQPFLDEQINPVKDSYQKELTARDEKIMNLEVSMECMARRNDANNYPDFVKLEEEIQRLAADPNCPVDFSRSTGEVIDTLYSLVRSKHSSDALVAAEKSGVQKAEERLAKESQATVAGGGKTGSSVTPDLNKIKDINKLREMVAKMHGTADRD